VGGEKTSEHTLDWAVRFYRHIGKRPIRLKKEIEGYLANRLQRVVFEEALRLIDDGICDHDDLEDVMTWGLGPRWATVGLLLHRHLGGGKGGVRHMFDHFGWSGSPGGDVAFIDAVERRWAGQSVADLESWRDDNLLTMLEQLKPDPGRRHDAESDQ
jgi:3-hydroxyacyl-CoA dehydrogenase